MKRQDGDGARAVPSIENTRSATLETALAEDDTIHLARLAIVENPSGFLEHAVAASGEKIPIEKFEIACEASVEKISKSCVHRLFGQLDTDCDGKISKTELINTIEIIRNFWKESKCESVIFAVLMGLVQDIQSKRQSKSKPNDAVCTDADHYIEQTIKDLAELSEDVLRSALADKVAKAMAKHGSAVRERVEKNARQKEAQRDGKFDMDTATYGSVAEHHKWLDAIGTDQGGCATYITCFNSVDMGLKRMNVNFLREIYDRHKDDSGGLPAANLSQALSDADAPIIPDSEDAAADLISRFARTSSARCNANGKIEFNEYRRCVFAPDQLHLWYQEKNMPMMADALRPLVGRSSDQLQLVSKLSAADVRAAWSAVCARIQDHAEAMHKLLQLQFETHLELHTQSQMNSGKFTVQKMASGTIVDFHQGLQGRVGTPHLKFEVAMRREHCQKPGWDKEFTTSNYSVTTTPKQEWQYIVGDERGTLVPVPKAGRGHGRRLVPISELMLRPLAIQAKLIRAEVIAIVMYSGPMYVVYNAILRRFPPDVYQTFEQGKNMYPTTIFVLASAVQKLSRCTRIPEGTLLFRGLGGLLDLPDTFHQMDLYGRSGYADWGFMSTTMDLDVALGYSGVRQRRPNAMVMVIEAWSVDRGACISEFSQYPQECEYLWLPCSFVQRMQIGGGRVEVVDGGLVTMFSVRVNLNLKSETVEELQQKKKSAHLTAMRAMVDEVRFELDDWTASGQVEARLQRDETCNGIAQSFTAHGAAQIVERSFTAATLAAQIVEQCEEIVKRHEAAPLEEYVDDGAFRSLVSEMLDAKAWAIEKTQLWMQDQSQYVRFIQKWSLRDCHRMWQSFLRRRTAHIQTIRAAAGSTEIAELSCKLLLSRGLVIGVAEIRGNRNTDGESVLVQAGGDGWEEGNIAAAVSAGADVNDADRNGCTGVWLAARYGHAQSLAALIAAGGDVSKCSADGCSPILMAARYGHYMCLNHLIAAGGDVKMCMWNGISPIFLAAQEGHDTCLGQLIAAGGDVHNGGGVEGWFPLYNAAKNGHVSCLSQLLAAGADVSALCYDGTSSLDIALKNEHSECVRLLVAAGAGSA